jgi:serine/threonine protein kinase
LPEQIIGEGNYSKVYKIEIDGQFFAVKQLKRESIHERDPEIMANLEHILNEVSVLSKSKNPRIIKLVGKYRTKDYYHLITEYCNGGSL